MPQTAAVVIAYFVQHKILDSKEISAVLCAADVIGGAPTSISSKCPLQSQYTAASCYRSTSIRSAKREPHKPEGRAAAPAVFGVLMSRKIGAAFGFDASTRLHAHAAAAGPSAGSHIRSITDARTRASKTAFGRPGVVNIEKPSSQISAVRTYAQSVDRQYTPVAAACTQNCGYSAYYLVACHSTRRYTQIERQPLHCRLKHWPGAPINRQALWTAVRGAVAIATQQLRTHSCG